MHYTLRQLEVFVATARLENVSRAAEALNLSQSAASSALTEFERQAQPLFERLGRRLRLNERGRLLLPRAVELLDRARAFDGLLRDEQGLGALRVGASLTIGNYLAPLIIADYLQRHPDSQISLHVDNTSAIVAQAASFDIDLGLVEGAVQHPDIQAEVWLDDELVVFCAPAHPLAKTRTATEEITPDTLATQDWILREHGSGTRATLEQALGHIDLAPRIRLELEHTEAIKRAVEAGLGIGCISRLALRDAFRRGSLVPLCTPALNLNRRFQFVWRRGKYHSPALEAFITACRRISGQATRSDDIPLMPVP